MEIRAPSAVAPGAALNSAGPQSSMPSWQLGQLLQARVMSAHAGRIELDVAGQRLTADTPLALQPGQILTLKVSALEPRPTLSVQNQAGLIAQAYEAIRVRMVQQQGLDALLPALKSTSPAAAEVAELAAQLLQNLSTPAELGQPDGLTQPSRVPASFWEAALSMQGKAGPRDLKPVCCGCGRSCAKRGRRRAPILRILPPHPCRPCRAWRRNRSLAVETTAP